MDRQQQKQRDAETFGENTLGNSWFVMKFNNMSYLIELKLLCSNCTLREGIGYGYGPRRGRGRGRGGYRGGGGYRS